MSEGDNLDIKDSYQYSREVPMTKSQPQVIKDTIKTILTLSNEIQTQKKFLEDVIKTNDPAYTQWFLLQLSDVLSLEEPKKTSKKKSKK